MPNLTFELKYGNFNGDDGLLLSPSELLEQYFHGIPICTADGRELTQETIRQKILEAQEAVENFLGIKLFRQQYIEKCDFVLQDWREWGFVRTTYQVRNVLNLQGWLGGISQIDYPISWVSIQEASDEKNLFRQIHLVPSGKAANIETSNIVAVGVTPHAGFLGLRNIPNYWNVTYCTGFNKVPRDIFGAIGKLASISLFAILGDILLGAGIASKSLSYDGLSESITTTQSAENSAYSARVRQYQGELKIDLKRMRDYYMGIRMRVL